MSGALPTTGRTGLFIDFSNLFWAIKRIDSKTGKRLNYDICFKKLRHYLKERHAPVFYNVYACEDTQPTKEPFITKAQKFSKFLNFLSGTGYNVIRKDLKHIGETTKCDTDVEITMDLHRHVNDMENIILFSGDSDFLVAVQHFQSIGKYVHIYSFASGLSWELKTFAIQNPRCNFTLLDDLRTELEKEK